MSAYSSICESKKTRFHFVGRVNCGTWKFSRDPLSTSWATREAPSEHTPIQIRQCHSKSGWGHSTNGSWGGEFYREDAKAKQENYLIGGSTVKHLPADAGSVPGLGRFPEMAMAIHSSTFAWKISRTKQPGRLQSMESPKELVMA